MTDKERFDQLERLLADVLRRTDRLTEFVARQEEFNANQAEFNANQAEFNASQAEFNTSQMKFNASQAGFNTRQEQRLDGLSSQLEDVIGILKISAEAHRQSGERQDQMLRAITEQGRRTDATQAEILRLMQDADEQKARTQALAQQLGEAASHEPRIQRLESEVFRAAS